MSDLDKLKAILNNQAEWGIRSGDWQELFYEETYGARPSERCIKISSLQVGFMFTSRGRLIGAYNWKE